MREGKHKAEEDMPEPSRNYVNYSFLAEFESGIEFLSPTLIPSHPSQPVSP